MWEPCMLSSTPLVYAVAAKQDPSPEEVDEAQAAVLAALALLFDQHKHIMPGWEDKRLDII